MFSNYTDPEELRKAYRNACKTLHPDMGGDVDDFRKMKESYVNRLSTLLSEKDNKTEQLIQLLIELLPRPILQQLAYNKHAYVAIQMLLPYCTGSTRKILTLIINTIQKTNNYGK